MVDGIRGMHGTMDVHMCTEMEKSIPGEDAVQRTVQHMGCMEYVVQGAQCT